ncbi:Retrovirus-related Pol polyprotein from transposon TNT 1-94 [Vitis vinifera]|uniref:Retrovirus-related Pol polyprotein from transposon TNT 1-94 n=1 Tax=Vitis vinifera TaxID=29760 RepID=A0A438FDB5_VITVI|nr:Retrovirus-related Pol polyprotein from transposon TNT 1-94 [Vitis vinifera]
MSCKESELWYNAMKDEMSSMKCNDVWDLVELPNGAKTIGCKWVFKTKKDSLGNIENTRPDLLQRAHFDLELQQMDVKTTFLNGELEEEVYMKQPEGFPSSDGEQLVSGSKVCFLVLYVDDILLATNDKGLLHEVKQFLSKNFDMKDMGRYKSNPGKNHWKAAKKVMRYLQGTKDYKLMYRRTSNLKVVATQIQTLLVVLIHVNQHLDSFYIGR